MDFWVHRRGATQGQGGEWARGPCDNVQGGATCAEQENVILIRVRMVMPSRWRRLSAELGTGGQFIIGKAD